MVVDVWLGSCPAPSRVLSSMYACMPCMFMQECMPQWWVRHLTRIHGVCCTLARAWQEGHLVSLLCSPLAHVYSTCNHMHACMYVCGILCMHVTQSLTSCTHVAELLIAVPMSMRPCCVDTSWRSCLLRQSDSCGCAEPQICDRITSHSPRVPHVLSSSSHPSCTT